jgi:hypothetical protein
MILPYGLPQADHNIWFVEYLIALLRPPDRETIVNDKLFVFTRSRIIGNMYKMYEYINEYEHTVDSSAM